MSGKRAFDIVASAVGLLPAGLVIAVLLPAIRFSSPGPVFFRQQRVGQGERTFTCIKLRTMRVGVPSVPTHEAPPNALTPVGAFLRRWKLDELPQLWNVLKGEMSLVGPRPCLVDQHALIEERRRRHVFRLRPGITGLAQVNGIDMSNPARLAEMDAIYLARMSFRLDLMILFRTFVPGRHP